MNKTKIEWTRGPNGEPGYTWNPVTGCLHGCSYCYGWSPKQDEELLGELCTSFSVNPAPILEKFRRGIRALSMLERLETPVPAEELQVLIRHEMEAEALKVVAG